MIGGGRLFAVFQSHTYTRTAAFFAQICESLRLADRVLIADIYAARETDTLGVSSELLAEKTPNGICLSTFGNIAEYLKTNCDENDIIMILGAGDIIKVADLII